MLKELTKDGWLTIERDETDHRMRKVHASDWLRLHFDEYQRFLFELLSSAHEAVPPSGQSPSEDGVKH